MKKSICLVLTIILSLLLFSIQSFAYENQSTVQIDNMSITQLPWDKEGCGIHYILKFTVSNSVVKNINVGDNLHTINTESELLKDRSCTITVDDGRVFTPGYTDYYAGWSETRKAMSRGINTCGAFKQNISEGVGVGHTITIEVYQRATTTNDLLKPQILLADVEDPGAAYPLCVVYGSVVFNDNSGKEEYLDIPFSAKVKEDVIVTAERTSSIVLVNGKIIEFDAYNIENNNYFKLRDIAYALSGTEKQFDVSWGNNCIKLIPQMPYTIVGGEMARSDEQFKNAKLSNDVTILHENGYGLDTELFKNVYNIDDNNYFKLRDIGRYFDFDVSWDAENNTVLINTKDSYTED